LNLYGPPTAALTYSDGLTQHLRRHQYIPTSADPSVFNNANQHSILAVTTDDFLITPPTPSAIDLFVKPALTLLAITITLIGMPGTQVSFFHLVLEYTSFCVISFPEAPRRQHFFFT
ncbi:MAG: hypothetical protein AAF423_14290, partial [Pseudomonadota bacterium]